MSTRPAATQAAHLKQFIEENEAKLRKQIAAILYGSGKFSIHDTMELTEELLSEMTVEALTHAERFDPNRPPMAWLLGIAVNLMFRRVARRARQARRETFLEDLTPEANAPDGEGNPWEWMSAFQSDSLEDNVLATVEADALLALVSPTDQQVLRWGVLEGLKGKELAAMMGTTMAAATVRLHRAKRRLLEALTARADEGEE